MTVRFRNDHGEDRICPTLGYVLVPAGETITVPDDEYAHWVAGGWTALDPDPAAPKPATAAPAAPAAPAAAAPAAAPPAPEGAPAA